MDDPPFRIGPIDGWEEVSIQSSSDSTVHTGPRPLREIGRINDHVCGGLELP